MSDDKLERERKFKDLLVRLKDSPFYKRKLADYHLMNIELKQISKLPITVKGELRKVGAFDHLAVDRKEVVHYYESLGTSGEPTSAWFTKEDLETGIRQIKGCGVRLDKEDIVLFRFPHGLTATAFLMQQTCLQVGAMIIPENSSFKPYPKVLDLIQRLNVTIIAGSFREIELLVETARLLGLNSSEDFPSLRAIIVTGEVVGERRKEHLKKRWGVPIIDIYSTAETANIAAMCEHGTMHVLEHDVVVEVLKEDGSEFVQPGERGLATITTLSHQASSLLRYLNEDVISVEQGLCACGKSERKLVHYGRLRDRTRFGEIMLDDKDIQDAIYSLAPVPDAWKAIQKENGFHMILDSEQYTHWSLEEIQVQLSEMLKVTVTAEIGFGTLLNREELIRNAAPMREVYICKLDKEDSNPSSFILLRDLLRRGYSEFMSHNYKKALQLFEEALALMPHSAEAHAWLAAVYGRQIDAAWSLTEKIKLFSMMENEIKAALEIDPNLPLARRMNGSKLLNTPDMLGGDPTLAADEFRYCIDQGMNDIEIWVSLAECYMKMDDPVKAQEVLKVALAIEPQHERSTQLLLQAKKREQL
jgi:phenylacetate-CoA ligase